MDPTKKYNVRLFIADINLLREQFPNMGYNAVIRRIVHLYCNQFREESQKTIEESNIKIEV